MNLKIYGIPTCNSCKKAMKWLDKEGHPYQWVDLRKEVPPKEKIHSWVQTLGSKPLRNTSGQSYRALGSDRETWTEKQWIEAFSQDPMLLKRPLLEANEEAKITGFQEDTWKALFDSHIGSL